MTENNTEEKKIKHKKPKFTRTTLICILLAIAVCFLGIAEYANLHRDQIGKKIAESMASSSNTSAAASATALPVELTIPDSVTVLVNKTHMLPSGYAPADSDLATPYLNSSTDAIRLRTAAADQAKAMKAAADAAGVTLIVSAGYITFSEQQDMYLSTVNLLGGGEDGAASTAMEKAGYSEHQTGLAIDFTNDASQAKPTKDFANTPAGQWLYQNAYQYGFILRYPKGKESITGYDYMPWHYRYVGVDVATAMHGISADETMEEYYNARS